jgi:hypothetical protein
VVLQDCNFARVSYLNGIKAWFKKAAKVASILLILLGCALLWLIWVYLYRPTRTVGKWTEPEIGFSDLRHSISPDGRRRLLHYYYSITQTAALKYPYYIWKGTAWERRVTEGMNVIDRRFGLAVVDGDKVELLTIEEPIKTVIWMDDTAYSRTAPMDSGKEPGWYRISGHAVEKIPAFFEVPVGGKETLCGYDASAQLREKLSNELHGIERLIRSKQLGRPDGRNHYKPIKY